jgi:exosortase B
MSSVLQDGSGAFVERRLGLAPWLLVVAGLLALFVPTYFDLSRGLWTQDDYLHGPIALAVSVWLAWQAWPDVLRSEVVPAPAAGWLCLGGGLLLYVLGRSQEIILFEVGSQIPILGGVLLVLRGWPALRRLWFPLLFLVFMVPLPGFIVDALTNPLKHNVSAVAEDMLYRLGYPIARSGVVLSIGNYQLLVADACSGLHSLFSMAAMGLLYMHLSAHRSIVRNVLLGASLIPIAICANIVRVVVLVLVTYHFGDEAGQGFIHGFSGIFLFIVGLLIIFTLDAILGRVRALSDSRVAQ